MTISDAMQMTTNDSEANLGTAKQKKMLKQKNSGL
jgi:hypothetical protein